MPHNEFSCRIIFLEMPQNFPFLPYPIKSPVYNSPVNSRSLLTSFFLTRAAVVLENPLQIVFLWKFWCRLEVFNAQ